MGNLTQDIITVADGKLHFIPSGSTTTGVSQSIHSIAQNYVVTMSGASLSQSVLAPHNNTASFWYFRTPTDYSFKVFYQNLSQSAVEPTGSGNLSSLPNTFSSTSTGSAIRIMLDMNQTGSSIADLTYNGLIKSTLGTNRYTVSHSLSSSFSYIHINSAIPGAPPADDVSFTYMSGSSITYCVPQSGSGLPYQLATVGTPSTASATVKYQLTDDKASAELVVPTSESFMRVKDGYYAINVTNSTTGSGVSLHGGLDFDYGQPLPNSPYIKTNGGFDIYMDNANTHDNSEFRVFKNTGLAGVPPGEELLTLSDNGDLTVSGSIVGGTF